MLLEKNFDYFSKYFNYSGKMIKICKVYIQTNRRIDRRTDGQKAIVPSGDTGTGLINLNPHYLRMLLLKFKLFCPIGFREEDSERFTLNIYI